MKTSHGVIQGYNSQALIDGKHQVIIHAEAFGRGQDHAHGPPMLDGALENLKSLGHGEEYFAGKIFTADTNYHSDTNLRKCQELRLDAYIPDLYFRRRDPRYAAQRRYWPRRKRFTLEDFHYEEATDHYLCPQGKRLRRIAKKVYARWFGAQNICGRGARLSVLSPAAAVSDRSRRQTKIFPGTHRGRTHQPFQENGRQG